MGNRILLFAFVLAFLAPAVLAQDYEIRLSRPVKPGDQLKLSIRSKLSQFKSRTVGGAAPEEQKQEIAVQLEGVEKVIDVDAQGRETKIMLTVDKLTESQGGNTSDVLPAGSVVICSVNGKKQFYEIDGKEPGPKIAQALSLVVHLSHDGPLDDAVIGTKEKKKKGESWDVNADLAKSSFAESAGGMEMTEFTGKTTLDDVVGENLKISSQMKGKFKPSLPPQIIVDEASFEADSGGAYPIDTTKPAVQKSGSTIVSIATHSDMPQGKVVIKWGVTQTQDGTETLVK